MGEGYDNVIAHASRDLADAVLSTKSDLLERADSLDVTVLELVRRVGRSVCGRLLGALADKVVAEAKAEGFTPQDRKRVKARSILGVIEVPSPYMRNPRSGETARPVKARLGIRGGGKTTAVERALADFGAEESFALASAGCCSPTSNAPRPATKTVPEP